MKPGLGGMLSGYGAVLLLSALSRAALVDPLPQSWFFDFYSPDDLAQPLLFPVVRQCDTLTIQWTSEGASEYVSTSLPSPNTSYQVTSPPQSQFQVCMVCSPAGLRLWSPC
ncbi:hypothetical protein K523DRAFT_322296 [Schizophyllum commune Tattone D]|nr:hypothetical protein K523DRAFT_322296 [Schizophyllum commune Tattone D]